MTDVVQSTNAHNTSASVTATLTGVTAGNSLVAVVQYENNVATAIAGNLVDGSGNTWSLAYAPANGFGFNGEQTAHYWLASASSGTHAITWTNPGTAVFQNMTLFETVPLTAVDQTATTGPGQVTDTTTPGTTSTTTQANEMVFVTVLVCNTFGAVSITTPSGYTLGDIEDPFNNQTFQTSWKTVAATGTQSATWNWTFGSGRETTASIVTYKKAVSGGGTALMGQACL